MSKERSAEEIFISLLDGLLEFSTKAEKFFNEISEEIREIKDKENE